MSNQHTAQAILRLRNGTHNEVARAHVEATLALADEQRTANLIAFERTRWEAWRRDEMELEDVEMWTRAVTQIAERLGLS